MDAHLQNYNKEFEVNKHIPNAHKIIKSSQERSTKFRKDMQKAKKARLDIKYGQNDRNVMDVFSPGPLVRSTLIFLHGGYWLNSDKSHWSHLASGSVQSNVRVAIPNYSLCPDADVSEIILEIKQCIEFVAKKFNGPIIIVGHQAGGFLAARMACMKMLSPDIVARISHVMPIAPLSDLRPLVQTTMNNEIALSEEKAIQESPALLEVDQDIMVTVWVGSDDQPIYLQQAKFLATQWNCFFVKSQNRNHLDVLEGLESASSRLLARLFVNLEEM